MRGTRWLLVAIVVVIGSVAFTYYSQRRAQERAAPVPPKALPPNVAAEQQRWTHTETDGQRTVWQAWASRMQQLSDPPRLQLEGLELHLFDSDGTHYNNVRCAFASLDPDSGVLYSEGAVEIIVGVPVDDSAPEDSITIRSSGVRFNLATGRAETERAASFVFAGGEGRSVGAMYDPESGELRMLNDVELHWRGDLPITVKAGQLSYTEDSAVMHLSPWSRMERGSLVLDADASEVGLDDGAIRDVRANNARGTSRHGGRLLEYSAQLLEIEFAEDSAIRRIVGRGGASVAATSETSGTTVTGDELVLDFIPNEGESILQTALVRGSGVLESRPLAARGGPLPPARVMRSEVLSLRMRPDGSQIEELETGAPGTIEFLPSQPGQPHRRLDGGRLWIRYAENNAIESFRAVEVATRTERPAEEGEEPPPPMLTWSDVLEAAFDPITGELVRLEQSGDFRYEEGTRRGVADRAVLDAALDTITLVARARLSDDAGSTSADTIVLDQGAGNLTATGNVSSTRLPDGEAAAGALLNEGTLLHATAEHMATADGSRKIVYEGGVVIWQGWNRLEGDRVAIDRDAGALDAAGSVVTRVGEVPRNGASGPANPGVVYTLVRASELSYQDAEQLAHFRGGVQLERPGMDVSSRELRAWFAQAGDGVDATGSRLNRAFADGEVEIVNLSKESTQTSSADHAEYYPAEEKVFLQGGRPRLVDSVRGATEGEELTYFVGDGTLLVDGTEAKPAVSQLRRRNR